MAVTVKLGEKKVWKVIVGVASNGTKDHNKLENRDAANQHPMSAISGLETALMQKAPTSHQHTKEEITNFPTSLPASDVYEWAKQPQKPSYTAGEVKARPNTWLPTPEQIGAAPALDWSHLKWYVMGDSLTDRNASHTDKYYYDFVQEKTGIQVIVDGIGGTGYGAGASNSESYLDRVQNIPDDVDIVTIFGSGNDIRFAESANMEIYNTLSWLALNKPGLRVIVVPPAPWLGYNKREDPWKAYCDRLQACALACDFRYLSDMYDCPPFNPNFAGHMEVFFTTDPEGIHPDENGHKALAPYFYNALLEELALDKGVVVSPGGSGGSVGNANGLNDTARALLITILRNAVYSTDQSANITALEAALASGSSSGGSETPDNPGDGDEPITPVEPTDPVYILASPLTTDGASMVDTGYALADKDKNWTIVCDITGTAGYGTPAWGLGQYIAMWARSAWQWYCGYGDGNYTIGIDALKLVTGHLTNFKTVLIHNKGEETITTYYVSNSALATLTASNRNYSSFVGTADTVTLGGATDTVGDKLWEANNTINDFKIYERVLTEDEIKAYLGVA